MRLCNPHDDYSPLGIAIGQKTLSKKGPHDLKSFSRVLTVNTIGTFNVIRLAAEKMALNAPDDDGEADGRAGGQAGRRDQSGACYRMC